MIAALSFPITPGTAVCGPYQCLLFNSYFRKLTKARMSSVNLPNYFNIPVIRIAVGDYAYNVRSSSIRHDLEARPNHCLKYTYSNDVVCYRGNSITVRFQFSEDVRKDEDGLDLMEDLMEVTVTAHDMKRLDVHLLSSCPFVSILLSKDAAVRIKKQLNGKTRKEPQIKFQSDSKARITIFLTHVEEVSYEVLTQKLCKNKVRILTYQEASHLLGQASLDTDQKLLDIENELVNKFKSPLANRVKDRTGSFEEVFGPTMPFADVAITPSVLAHELRRVSSYIHYFRDCGGTMEALQVSLDELNNLDALERLLRGLYWRYVWQ